jgi:hypothetical protein
MTARHPLAEKLRQIKANKFATEEELVATLEMAQLEVERLWDVGDPLLTGPPGCGRPGCNYRRYPASKFCMYHTTGNDTFAARLRRKKAAP